jgi:prepilin-type N-terminal cleavage/methylation domain-containing protein
VLVGRLRALFAEARGFTLTELLLATVLGLIVIGGGVTVFTVSMNNRPRIDSQSAAIQHARTAMERITRELRQSSTVSTATATQLSIVTYVHSATCGGALADTAISCRVTYTCSTGACTRTEANPDGTSPGPPVRVVSGLSHSNVFTYSPNSSAPTYVGATFAFSATGGQDAITLSDGTATRNSVSL